MDIKFEWKEQPRQLTFLRACGLSHGFEGGNPGRAVAKVVAYGGAAGGGKSDAMIMGSIIACCTYGNINVGFFRRTVAQLQGPGGGIMRSQTLLAQMKQAGLCSYNEQKNRWTFWNNSVIQFAYIQYEKDVFNYQSQQFDIICFDEATHFSRSMVRYMMTRNRRSNVKSKLPRTFAMMGTNPGNIGHVWFKNDFVRAGEPEQVHLVEVEPGAFEEHIFIPAKLSDNQALEQSDPEYRKNLENQPEHIRLQLLEGNWDVAEGAAFPEWRREVHVVEPFEIDPEWVRFRSLDWGHSKPYCVGWYAVDYDGRLYKYRELYGWGGEADKGSKEDPADVAEAIWNAEHWKDENGKWVSENIRDAVADDAIFGGRQDNSKDIAEQFHDKWMELDKRYNVRTMTWRKVGKGGKSRISGKLEVHHRLKIPVGEDKKPTGEPPMLLFFNNCSHTIRTLPEMLLDEKNPEDVNTTMEDHAYDETRYACMSRPIISKPKKEPQTVIQKHKQRLVKKRTVQRARIL